MCDDSGLENISNDISFTVSATLVLTNSNRTRRDEYLRKVGKTLTKHLWYHGLMPRQAVEEVLRQEGDFLVRKTDKDGKQYFCLSVKCKDGDYCHIIIHCKNKQWTIKNITKSSLIELIITHFNEKIPVKSDGTLLLTGIPRSTFLIMHEDVDLGEKIGTGAYGEVCVGVLRRESEDVKVAVKTLKREVGKQERVDLVNEAKIICQLDHPNIVKVYGIAPLEEPMLMVMEYASGGGLPGHLKSHPNISVEILTRYTIDAARGMVYLSTRGIVHRDIAARNCLLGSNNEVKIADFGMSIVVQNECRLERVGKVPIRWLAPESLRSRRFSVKSDVWSFGVLIWEIFTKRQNRPYYEFSNSEAKRHVLAGNTLGKPEGAPKLIVAVMEKCFSQDPDLRPDFVELLKMLSPNEKPPVPEAGTALILSPPSTQRVSPSISGSRSPMPSRTGSSKYERRNTATTDTNSTPQKSYDVVRIQKVSSSSTAGSTMSLSVPPRSIEEGNCMPVYSKKSVPNGPSSFMLKPLDKESRAMSLTQINRISHDAVFQTVERCREPIIETRRVTKRIEQPEGSRKKRNSSCFTLPLLGGGGSSSSRDEEEDCCSTPSTPTVDRQMSLKERMVMRMSRKSKRRESCMTLPPVLNTDNDDGEDGEETDDWPVVSPPATSTPNPPRRNSFLKKVKSLSPCKSPRKMEIPNVFKKNEDASSFCFTNIMR